MKLTAINGVIYFLFLEGVEPDCVQTNERAFILNRNCDDVRQNKKQYYVHSNQFQIPCRRLLIFVHDIARIVSFRFAHASILLIYALKVVVKK